jgi:nucleoside-diphosphate-sugar epimerase
MQHPTQHHVIVGAGPVGSGVARLLAQRGEPVTVITRRGTGPTHPLITRAVGDATDADLLTRHTAGAAAIYNCANPPYHRWATDWPPMHRAMLAAAERSDAVLVMMDNLYAFGPDAMMPMSEGDELRATGTKGAMRATMARELLQAHADGRVRATLARASDFFGPEVLNASLGERVMPRLLVGKKVSLLGRLDVAHSASFMPDVVRTLVTIAADERAWGHPWHVPNATAVTQRELVAALASAAGTTPKVSAIPKVALSALGLVVPMMRELKETWYQFDQPFITDSKLTESTFDLTPTPLDQAAHETVEWWRQR